MTAGTMIVSAKIDIRMIFGTRFPLGRVALRLTCDGGERAKALLPREHRLGRPETQRLIDDPQPMDPIVAQSGLVYVVSTDSLDSVRIGVDPFENSGRLRA